MKGGKSGNFGWRQQLEARFRVLVGVSMKFCNSPSRATMRLRVRAAAIWLMAVSLVGVPTFAYAQEHPADPLKTNTGDTPTFKSEVYVVNALATVRDKHGQIVNNLTKDDFVLQVDGKPTAIKYFARESDLPLTLGLLVDTSLSQRRVLEEERTASYQFLNEVMREDRDVAFVIQFDFETDLLQDLTNSRQKLEVALDRVHVTQPDEDAGSPGGGRSGGGGGYPSGGGGGYPSAHHRGGTMLYDAVFLASDELMRKQKGRKALILLTDGVDQGSKVSLDRAIETAQRADTMVYSILFSDPSAYSSGGYPRGGYPGGMGRHGGWGGPMGGGGGPVGGSRYPSGGSSGHADGKKVLQRMSKETGGRFFEVSKKESVEDIYKQVQEELRNQYSLGFSPDKSEDAANYHKIVLTTKQKDLVVQTREGYYQK